MIIKIKDLRKRMEDKISGKEWRLRSQEKTERIHFYTKELENLKNRVE